MAVALILAIVSVVLTVAGTAISLLANSSSSGTQYGSRLNDTNVATVSPGNPIARMWGSMRLASQIIWTTDLIETKTYTTTTTGGKGGGHKSRTTTVTYTYSVDCAFALCQGPIRRVLRIRANEKLLWVNPDMASQEQTAFDDAYTSEGSRLLDLGVDVNQALCSAFMFAFNNYSTDEYTFNSETDAKNYILSHPVNGQAANADYLTQILDRMFNDMSKDAAYPAYKKRYDNITCYHGSNWQMPDGTIESYKGVGNVPAYRGIAYVVLTGLQLVDFGNTVPQLLAEVEKEDGKVYLYNILHDLCADAGMPDTKMNFDTSIRTTEVKGYAVTDSTSSRDAIQRLQKVYPFTAAETASALKFTWITRRAKAIMRREDLQARQDSASDIPAPLEIVRTQDFDLPKILTIQYQEPVRNYSTNMVKAERQFTYSNTTTSVHITLAMDRVEAKSRAEAMLTAMWMARRSYKAYLPRKYAVLDPGDVVLLPDADDPKQFSSLQVTAMNIGANGIIEMSMTDYFDHDFVVAIAGTDDTSDTDGGTSNVIAEGSRTYPYMLDTPLLTNTEEDNIGFYTVLGGTKKGWSGGMLVVDLASGGTVPVYGNDTEQDSQGAQWTTVASNSIEVGHGFVMQVPVDGLLQLWDLASTVIVKVLDPDIILTTVTDVDMLANGANAAMIGSEIIQFRTVVDLGNGLWKLTGLLRGLQGTEQHMAGHTPGEAFVMLDSGSVNRVVHDATLINVPRTFKALTLQEDPDTVDSFTFTNTGNSLRPYSPFIRSAVRMANGSIVMSWLPRVRQNGAMVSGMDTVLDQAVEKYELVVMNGTTEKRVIPLGAVRNYTYSKADMITDFGNTPSKVTFNLYQIGATIGRGFVSEFSA